MNALIQLKDALLPGEEVIAAVFGHWDGINQIPGYQEPVPEPVPRERRGIALSLAEAEPYMLGWEIDEHFGSPDCYAMYVWTTQRVGAVVQYDGRATLEWIPRIPTDIIPKMLGGG